MSTRFDDVSVEERLRDAARAYTDAIEPDPDAWLRLRTSIEDRRVLPRYRRRRVVAIAVAAAVVVAVVLAAVVVIDQAHTTKVSVPPATRPHLPVPNVALDHELLATPSSGLRDGQPIRVSGRHFIITVGRTQNVSRIVVVTCRAGATPANWDQQCDPRTDAGAPTSAGRNRELRRQAKPGPARETCCLDVVQDQYAAVRHLNLPGGPVDCALEPCVVLMFGSNTRYGVAPLRFDAGAASLPTPRVTVTPSTDLQEGQQVTVHIEDAWPGGADHRGVYLNLCGGPGDARACDQTDLGVPAVTGIDGQGRTTLTITVRSTVLSDGCCTAGDTAGVADCTQPPGCALLLRVPAGPLAGQSSELAIPITFSADVNARPLADRVPHATIDPPGPYTDGQQATISATGVPPGTAIGQCATFDPSPTGTGPPTFLYCPPGGVTGNGTLVLHRFIDVNALHPKIDCSEPGRCALYLYTADPNRGGGLPPGALLEFAPLTVN